MKSFLDLNLENSGEIFWWTFILLFLTGIFMPYIFLRPDLVGMDSYAFATAICKPGFSSITGNNIAGFFAFKWLPCNITTWKMLQLASFLFFGTALASTYRLFKAKSTFLGIIISLGFSPIILMYFFKFENEFIALPFIAWSLFFFWRAIQKKEDIFKPKNLFISFTLLLIGGLVWHASFFVMVALGATFLPYLLFTGALSPFFSERISFFFGLNTSGVIESRLGGIASLWLLTLLFFWLPLQWTITSPIIVMSLLAYLNPKLLVFLVLLLTPVIASFIEWVENKKFWWVILVLALIGTIGFALIVVIEEPTKEDWRMVDLAISTSESHSIPLNNDWSDGYWIVWKGKETFWKGGGRDPDYNTATRPFVALTQSDLSILGCEEVDSSQSFRKTLYVSICE